MPIPVVHEPAMTQQNSPEPRGAQTERSLPQLWVLDYSVEIGSNIDIFWDTGSDGDGPFNCLLTGGGLNESIVDETGDIAVDIYVTTVFTLTCDNGFDTLTVFAIPQTYEQ